MTNVFDGVKTGDTVKATVKVEGRIVHDGGQYLIEQKNQAGDVIRVYREEEIQSIVKQ